MRRRVVLNLSLALLVAGLGLFVALSPPGKKPALQPPLVSNAPAAVNSIQVERAGKPALHFTRTGDAWTLREPIVAPAHPRRIQALLAVPTLPVAAKIEIGRADLARFDLDPPLATLRLNDVAFEFGATEALNGWRYIRYQQQLHLVPDTVYLQMTQGADFFIDTRLLKEGLRPERIAAPQRTVWLQDGTWRSDPEPATDEPPADTIAPAWEAAQALAVRVGADLDGGQRITLTFAQGITVEFDFVAQAGNPVLLRRDLNLQYHLDAEQARRLMLVPGAVPDSSAPTAY